MSCDTLTLTSCFLIVIGSITVASVYCWRVGLVVLAAFPLIAISGMNFKILIHSIFIFFSSE